MKTNGFMIRPQIYDGSRSNQRYAACVFVGLILGFCLARLYVFSSPDNAERLLYAYQQYGETNEQHVINTSDQQISDQSDQQDIIDETDNHELELINDDDHHSGDLELINTDHRKTAGGPQQHLFENNTLARKLYKEVRVLCWIMTNPKNHITKAKHVKRTWGRRCNKLILMSSVADKRIGTIALPVSEGRNNLWDKTKEAFTYIYEHHFNDYDWFLKADDDTYTVVENLRYFLYPYSPETPIFFGCKFKAYVKQGYMSGGAGYVLSREALRRFVEEALPNPEICRGDGDGSEDVEIAKCLENVNVIAGDSRDRKGRGRFFPFVPVQHLLAEPGDRSFWYWQNIYYDTDEGLGCCSDNAISFHYVPPKQMYVYDYFIYHLKPYGMDKTSQDLPKKLREGKTEPPPVGPVDPWE